jgi:hypothetical protein
MHTERSRECLFEVEKRREGRWVEDEEEEEEDARRRRRFG